MVTNILQEEASFYKYQSGGIRGALRGSHPNNVYNCGAISTFSAEDIDERTDIDSDRIKAFLRCFSVELGEVNSDFAQPSPTTPFLNRPYLGSGDKFTRVNSDAYSYLLPRIDGLMNADKNDASSKKQWKRYHTKRDAYLETKTIELFKRMMPSALAEHSLKYPNSDDPKDGTAELDGLVVHDNNFLLIEAKAATISEPTRRGSELKLQADAKKTIDKATEQAERAANFILQRDDRVVFTRKDGSELSIELPPVKHIYRIAVTLDHMDAVLVNTGIAIEAGLMPSVENYWSVGLRDLIVFADLIQCPTELLHYISRRNHLFKKYPMIVTDEIDLLGNYISSQRLYFDNVVKQEGAVITLVSHSDEIDNYYYFEQGARTKETDKPHLSFPVPIEKLLESLEADPKPCYSEASMRILSMSGDAHDEFSKGISACIERCSDRNTHSSIGMGLDNSSYGITYFVFPDCEAEEIKHTVGFYLEEKQRRTNAGSWVAVATLLSKPYKVQTVGMISNNTDRNY
ncbi:hypothetical protein Enr13x_04860 [Stieleria neptunia]|uniref:Nuclease-related domain protein n=1 Tax=Stieleria neptunia TaxID=2527979 RepID=A0A518HIJ6_9BACT|nr:hypothetical protein [Stieleria neptunia]QDV40652.1 hypothetical protein Enr13x_04860 [Stieleria neptunia]